MGAGVAAHGNKKDKKGRLKKPNLRCQLRDGKGYHLRTSKLNPLPPLLTTN